MSVSCNGRTADPESRELRNIKNSDVPSQVGNHDLVQLITLDQSHCMGVSICAEAGAGKVAERSWTEALTETMVSSARVVRNSGEIPYFRSPRERSNECLGDAAQSEPWTAAQHEERWR